MKSKGGVVWTREQAEEFARRTGNQAVKEALGMPKFTPARQILPSGGHSSGLTAEATVKVKKSKQMTRAEHIVDEMLRKQLINGDIQSYEYEGVRLKIGENTCHYTGDFAVFLKDGRLRIVEAKGAHIWEDGIVKFKCAKRAYPLIEFQLWQVNKLGLKQIY